MNIIEFALKMELDGKAFYMKHAAATRDPELREILDTLAEEEERHYQFFRTFKDHPDHPPSVDDFSLPETVGHIQNIFQEMSEQGEGKQFGNQVISDWAEALRIEEKAVKFYQDQAGKESDPARKQLLLWFAQEEVKHVHMIDGVLMYLRQPETFAHSAQFKNFMSLEGH